MNGYDYSKPYGNHEYPNRDGTSDCVYGCGCWMGPARSGGPIGLDPFGECPNNPTDGKRSSPSVDHEIVVERRMIKYKDEIYILQAENSDLKKKLKDVEPSKEELASTNVTLKSILEKTRQEFIDIEKALKQIQNRIQSNGG
jgi:hypothetical protein